MNLSHPLISKGAFISGSWQDEGASPLISLNPARGTMLWKGKESSKAQSEEAFAAAARALSSWALTPFEQRIQSIMNFAKQLEKTQTDLSKLIALETGKPLWEAKTEVSAVLNKCTLSIKAQRDRASSISTAESGIHSALRFKPQGVVLVLGAFNFPAQLSSGHIIPALLAGNTILFKPSELTPAVSEYLATLWEEALLPHGVFNLLQGGSEVAADLMRQPIDALYFTGSYETGLKINQAFAQRPEVLVALEMGGNNPLIIGKIHNQKAALYHTLLSGFLTAGQRCSAARRLFVPQGHEGNSFLHALKEAAGRLQVGDFEDAKEPFMGPVIRMHHAIKHLEAQKKLEELGGRPLLSMRLLRENLPFLSAGLIDMTGLAKIPDQEVFAPLMQIHRYDHFEEAIEKANETRFGLSASLMSEDSSQYEQFYQKIKAGLINWNRPTTGASSALPFGGLKASGNHRPAAYFASDYCNNPISSLETEHLNMPEQMLSGISL